VPGHTIIDGNNVLHAAHAHAPCPAVGRETLVKIVERWAADREDEVALVFDGPRPREGLARQMTSTRIDVRFSAPVTADDVIVEMIHRAKHPDLLRVVSSDSAIRHEAVFRRCQHVDAKTFVAELFPAETQSEVAEPVGPEKPEAPTPEETDAWIKLFGASGDPPMEGDTANGA
jgi:predicted RNA-binding protein with PIN domain